VSTRSFLTMKVYHLDLVRVNELKSWVLLIQMFLMEKLENFKALGFLILTLVWTT
jgi:hypothetical protein